MKNAAQNGKCECRGVFDVHADAHADARVNGPLR